MKRTEFKKWCTNNGYRFLKNDVGVRVAVFLGGERILIIADNIPFKIDTMWGTDLREHVDLFNKAVEYAKTPIEEREEPKKYYLIADWADCNHGQIYLNIAYGTHVKFSSKTEFSSFKTIFTEKEIDALRKRKVPVDSMEKIEVE